MRRVVQLCCSLKPLDDVEQMKRVTYLMKGESKFRGYGFESTMPSTLHGAGLVLAELQTKGKGRDFL